jgi:predicted RNase H-like nuclease (RuvC/YqgF family)
MVQTDLSQLSRECHSWKESLRNFRSEFSGYMHQLQEMVDQPIQKTALPQVEHLSNQFDIQLANINHLKHAIKEHEKMASWDINGTSGQVNEVLWSTHENLHDQYQSLENTLSGLKQEFQDFVRQKS